jgi:ATP-dependent DNA helicase RecG
VHCVPDELSKEADFITFHLVPSGTRICNPGNLCSEAPLKLTLQSEVQYVKGVGPGLAAVLRRLDIRTVLDLLQHFPRTHLDRTQFQTIASLVDGQEATVCATVRSVANFITGRKQIQLVKALLQDETASCTITFFNQPYLYERFRKLRERSVIVSGKVEMFQGEPTLRNVEVEELEEGEQSLSAGRIVPVYPLTEGLAQKTMRKIIRNALQSVEFPPDPLPQELRDKYKLPGVKAAYEEVHFPTDFQKKRLAENRVKFEELFALQLGFALRRHAQKECERGIAFPLSRNWLPNLTQHLDFELTEAQRRVIEEILEDMRAEHPMNRMLQGDVGAGKTVVAAAAISACAQTGFQAAIMAPTDVLAEQHLLTLGSLLARMKIYPAFLSGKLTKAQKDYARAQLRQGRCQVAIGTHALIQEGVEFYRLGLVVIDEQQRFGVLQRARLRQMGPPDAVPDVLVMTATPIPRTLALTVHGDLDISVLDELPPGRRSVKTELFDQGARDVAYGKLAQLLLRGEQAYVICPLVEESEKLSVKASQQVYEELQERFEGISVGLLHGQLKPKEKEEAMQRFRRGETRVLAATTVIEVGVDVPNATAILVENAERFGLAQLHQLRGRVARSSRQAHCLLVAAGLQNPETARRLAAICQITDGFKLAELDLEMRGMGEIAGTRQSGVAGFKLANIIRDQKILKAARKEAFALVERDPELALPEHRQLREWMQEQREKLELTVVS